MSERVIDIQGTPTLVREGGRGKTLLFFHGPEDPTWSPLLGRLAAKFRVVAPDHPGMGRTPLPPHVESMDDLVYHYLDLIDALELTGMTLVGASFGGWLAAELALAMGRGLRRLVLIDAAGLRVGDTDLPELYLMTEDDLAAFLVADRSHAGLVFPSTDDPAVFEQRLIQRATLARFTWAPYWHDPKLLGRLRRITAPALVLWGSDDRFIPQTHAKEFAARIPRATLQVVEGAGHLPHLEQPDRVAEAIVGFGRPAGTARSAGRTRRKR